MIGSLDIYPRSLVTTGLAIGLLSSVATTRAVAHLLFAIEPTDPLGVTTISILGVSIGVLVIDLLYPLLDPRVKVN